MELGLAGRAAIVTGGSAGLGRAIATTLAAEGASVAIVARGAERLEATAAEIRTRTPGAEVVTIPADVSMAEEAERIVTVTVDAFGQLDALVNNAGSQRASSFFAADDETWQADFDQKLLAAVRLVRRSVPHFRARGGGRIVNILSMTAKAPPAGSVPTSVTRAAGMALTKALSKELAADRILVNALLIGYVKSEQWEAMAEAAGGGPGKLDEIYAQLAKPIPLGRVGDAEEVADLVAFLLSERARYITGAAINFDGGLSPVV